MIARAQQTNADRRTLEHLRFSKSYNVRVEKSFPNPTWEFVRVKTGGPFASEASPNTTEPNDADTFDMTGYAGLSGYFVYGGTIGMGDTVDLHLWAKDTVNDNWFLVDDIINVAQYEEVRFPDAVRGKKVWLQYTGPGGNITSITFYGNGE